jgi:hypothetical protein
MSEPLTWTVTIVFAEEDDRTRADAVLEGRGDRIVGWGRARRNPVDPNVPVVGEDVAAARALLDLGHHLLEDAAHRIESWEGRSVHLQA